VTRAILLASGLFVLATIAFCALQSVDPSLEILRLDRRIDVLSVSCWGPDFEQDLQQFEDQVPERRRAAANVAYAAEPKNRGFFPNGQDRPIAMNFVPLDHQVAKAPGYTVLVMHQRGCPHCTQLVSRSLVSLAKRGWTTGQYGEPCHFQLVDCDEHPDMVERYSLHSVPTLIIVKDGKELARRTGYVTSHELANWVNKYTAPQPSPTYFAPRRWRR
jgi:thioredoxin 1